MIERGVRMPRLDTIVKVASAVDAEPCELLRGMAWRLAGVVVRPGEYVGQASDVAPGPEA
jgi:hypothetical protein